MLAPSHLKKKRVKKALADSDMSGVRVHCENGHAHLHVHEKTKRRKTKSKHKRKKSTHGTPSYAIFEAHGANGFGTVGIDAPEIIDISGDGPDPQIASLVAADVPVIEVRPVTDVQEEPVIVVEEAGEEAALRIAKEKRKSRSKKRKTKEQGCWVIFFDKSKAKKRGKKGPRMVQLDECSSATTGKAGKQRVVVARQPIYQEIIPGV